MGHKNTFLRFFVCTSVAIFVRGKHPHLHSKISWQQKSFSISISTGFCVVFMFLCRPLKYNLTDIKTSLWDVPTNILKCVCVRACACVFRRWRVALVSLWQCSVYLCRGRMKCVCALWERWNSSQPRTNSPGNINDWNSAAYVCGLLMVRCQVGYEQACTESVTTETSTDVLGNSQILYVVH